MAQTSYPASTSFSQYGRHAHESRRLECALQHLAQALQVQRFHQVVEGTALHRLDRCLRGAVSRDKDHGNFILGLDQLALEIKPADSWQSDVEDKAACNIGTAAVYKLRCRPEQFYVQTYGFYEAFDGATDRGIVINHENDGSWLTHLSSPAE